MSRLSTSLALVAATTMSYLGATLASETPASGVPVDTDLAAVIALQGLPCGKVVSASQQAQDDYIASCQDGLQLVIRGLHSASELVQSFKQVAVDRVALVRAEVAARRQVAGDAAVGRAGGGELVGGAEEEG